MTSRASLLSRRSSSIASKPEIKKERILSILNGAENDAMAKSTRPSLLRRSTTLSGYPKKEKIETNILDKADPRLFKDLPELPSEIQFQEDKSIEKDDVIIEENNTKSKLERRPRLKKVLSSPNRLSLLRPTPLKLNRFPDWLSGSNSRSPSNKSVSPLSQASTITESSNEEKARLTSKKSFYLLSPSDWLRSPKNKSMENCSIVPGEAQLQLDNGNDEIISLAEELDLYQSESTRTSFHSTHESILGTLPDTHTSPQTETPHSEDSQWSQESAKEMTESQPQQERNGLHVDGSADDTSPNPGSDGTIDQDNYKEALGESSDNAAARAEMLKIEEAWTAFNVSPCTEESERKIEIDQNAFPMSVDTLTSYDKSRCTPDVCERQQILTAAKPSLLSSISERTSSLKGAEFHSANSSMTELGEPTRSDAAKLTEEVNAEDKRCESTADSSRKSFFLPSISPTSSMHSPLSKNSLQITSIPSTPTSYTSTALSSPDARRSKLFSRSELAEFQTQSYWSEDSGEDTEEFKELNKPKERKVRNKRKFNKSTSSSKDENVRNSIIGKRLGLIFDHSFHHQTPPPTPNRKSFGKRKGNVFGGDSPTLDGDSSFLDVGTTTSSSKKPSRLLMSLTYVPQLLRHKGSTINLGSSMSTAATEMQRSKSANDLASSYKKFQSTVETSSFPKKIFSPTQSDHSESYSIPQRSVTSLGESPLLLSPITPQTQAPRSRRLSHKPSLPALLEGRKLTSDSHEAKLRQFTFPASSDSTTTKRSQSSQRSSWHPHSHGQQLSFQDNLFSNGWTMEREHFL
ncbi:uncharacterized protein FA14DRAFT_181834 [Meira miltonrushii]|uniref:Uncharacterized protein n=1 Tax=Meira miltonrushii TaxID=1280837 RepID=A0A316V3T6_9BASI|nr:uncharacterized protein FA14DRAFT_181834 [Meira miltonrushii]PWN31914.1 hypothetical protein FA14DRAFT_181834 [Meira miltonrushii]